MKSKLSILILTGVFLLTTKAQTEIIIYENKFDEINTPADSENELGELASIQKENLKKNSKTLTIRLEKGETLNLNNRKFILGNEPNNPGKRNYRDWGKVLVNIKYDNFSSEENIQIWYDYYSSGEWQEGRINSSLRYSSNLWPIEGPAIIEMHSEPYTYRLLKPGSKYAFVVPEQFFKVSFEKKSIASNPSNNQGSVLVLPDGVSGLKLKLESSTDLVNWTEDSLGSKDSSDKKRFYRLRAVKE